MGLAASRENDGCRGVSWKGESNCRPPHILPLPRVADPLEPKKEKDPLEAERGE